MSDPQVSEVRLRDVTESDLPIFFEHQLDPEAAQMADFPSRPRQEFMAHWTRILRSKTVLARTVLFNDEVASNVVFFEQSGEKLVGYWLGREFWGKDITTRALAEFLTLIEARPLYARVARHNRASIRVLEKCGFAVSGAEDEELILKLG